MLLGFDEKILAQCRKDSRRVQGVTGELYPIRRYGYDRELDVFRLLGVESCQNVTSRDRDGSHG